MSMYKLKSIARRGSIGALVAVFAVAGVPSVALADALNPLTERSLLLSSSAPGFTDTDGSGNSFAAPNSIGENYAPAGSGPNGKKSGETFTFKVSSTKTVNAFTFKYCTTAAGNCQAPGDNAGDARQGAAIARDTNLVGHALPIPKSDFEVVEPTAWTQGATAGQFQIYVAPKATPTAFSPVSATNWTMASTNKEDTAHSGRLTGKNNYITLTSATGEALNNGDAVKIVFKPSETKYITNPGSGSFFVKINTFDTVTTTDHVEGGSHNIDGGVTVANVMTDSIHITTKVLETMSFSVGVDNPDTKPVQHGICDSMSVINNNRLNLGDVDAEYSLSTLKAHDVFSYWRLSSNSSGGASVYYSGNTLANTVGDEINEIGTEKNSQIGTEQFGLALINAGADTLDTGIFPAEHVTPNVAPLNVGTAYDEGGAQNDNDISSTTTADNAKFSFLKSSLNTPELLAQNNDDVIRCATAKMRYVGNIAADTPAGVYTTKINYLAAPQY
ncbi:hypothetical protein EON76_01180 [bacterium]|nr:MAG: hypothetical protein EON76_01180 [bacterium]